MQEACMITRKMLSHAYTILAYLDRSNLPSADELRFGSYSLTAMPKKIEWLRVHGFKVTKVWRDNPNYWLTFFFVAVEVFGQAWLDPNPTDQILLEVSRDLYNNRTREEGALTPQNMTADGPISTISDEVMRLYGINMNVPRKVHPITYAQLLVDFDTQLTRMAVEAAK